MKMFSAVTISVIILVWTVNANPVLRNQSVILTDSVVHVSLHLNNEKFGIGVIVASEFVLTTASIVLKKPEHQITAVDVHTNATYSIKEIEYYYNRYDARLPNGDGTRSVYDVALIRINGKFDFEKSLLSYINLSDQGYEPKSDLSCELIGINEKGMTAMAFMWVLDQKNCSETYRNDGGLYPGEFCAIENDSRVCKGDEGSPLIHDGKLIGIASRLKDCEGERAPPIFVNVGFFHDWINSSMEIMLGKKERWFHTTWDDNSLGRFMVRLFESGSEVCEMGPKREKIRGDYCYYGCKAYGRSFGLCANNECICPAEDGDRPLYDLVKGISNRNLKSELCWQEPCRSHKPFIFF